MTLDAMDWVWKHSQSKGNTRIAMLFVADQVRTSAAEVRLSYPDFLRALNTPSRGTVRAALEAAEKSGELEIKEPGSGRRAPLYRLPFAVDYRRPQARSGPDSGPQSSDPESTIGPEIGLQGSRSGPEIDPLYPTTPSKQEERVPEQPAGDVDYGIPDAARPLVDSMTASGVVVRWPFRGDQWFPLLALINKCGVQALVEYARRTADRTHVDSARYFMRGWGELPPKPASGTPIHAPRPHLRAVGQSPEERGIF